MCRRVQCEKCLKPSFAGCGRHIEQVLRGVADSDRCRCHLGVDASAVLHQSAAPQPYAAHAE
ncbi:MAG: hypothetical protein ABW321_21475 [Polyangiales bacterium]